MAEMMKNCIVADRNQLFLLQPSGDEWLPKGGPARGSWTRAAASGATTRTQPPPPGEWAGWGGWAWPRMNADERG